MPANSVEAGIVFLPFFILRLRFGGSSFFFCLKRIGSSKELNKEVIVRARVVIRLGLEYYNRVGLEYCSLSRSLRVVYVIMLGLKL